VRFGEPGMLPGGEITGGPTGDGGAIVQLKHTPVLGTPGCPLVNLIQAPGSVHIFQFGTLMHEPEEN